MDRRALRGMAVLAMCAWLVPPNVLADRVAGEAGTLTASPSAKESVPTAESLPSGTELWRSAPIDMECVGIALGDVGGGGRQDLVAVSADQVGVYRYTDGRLESLGSAPLRRYGRGLSVEVLDARGQGRADVFVSVFQESIHRPLVVIFEWDGKELRERQRLGGLVRSAQRWGGQRALFWQDIGRGRDLDIRSISPLVWDGREYRPGTPLQGPAVQQVFGFAWDDWDRDGREDVVFLDSQERLRVFFHKARWRSRSAYGGTKNSFRWTHGERVVVTPRLERRQPTSGASQLVTLYNVPALGIHFVNLALYKRGEILGLAWDGLEMAPVWKIMIPGYIADFSIGDFLGSGSAQWVVAAEAPGDRTVFLVYALP